MERWSRWMSTFKTTQTSLWKRSKCQFGSLQIFASSPLLSTNARWQSWKASKYASNRTFISLLTVICSEGATWKLRGMWQLILSIQPAGPGQLENWESDVSLANLFFHWKWRPLQQQTVNSRTSQYLIALYFIVKALCQQNYNYQDKINKVIKLAFWTNIQFDCEIRHQTTSFSIGLMTLL